MAKSNWNKMANWYDGMVGTSGHKYHQDYAIPTVLQFLDIRKGQNILDIGCGQAALSTKINARGANYYGVDASTSMIKMAIDRHRNEGKFMTEDAAELENIQELKNIVFDSAVFMLSIQDMDPLDKLISSAAQKLKSGGVLVIFMMHPSFRIPRQSGWGEDAKRKLVYRRVDRYLSEETIPLNTNVRHRGKSVTSYFYHRPLQSYFTEFEKNGLVVEKLREISDEKKGLDEFPTFLALKLKRG